MARTVLPVRAEAPERLGRMVRMEPRAALGPLALLEAMGHPVRVGPLAALVHTAQVGRLGPPVRREAMDRPVALGHRGRMAVTVLPVLLEVRVLPVLTEAMERPGRAVRLVLLGPAVAPDLTEHPGQAVLPDRLVPMEPLDQAGLLVRPVLMEPVGLLVRRALRDLMVLLAPADRLVVPEAVVLTEPQDRLARVVPPEATGLLALQELVG